MAETGRTVSELVGEIGRYYMTKHKFAADRAQAGRILEAARRVFSAARVDRRDGCRFDFEDGWVHIRSSNTEPVMRAIVEAKDQDTAQRYVDAVMAIRGEIVDKDADVR